MNDEYIETNKQKICSCGGTAFTISKSVPPVLKWKYTDIWGEAHEKELRSQGKPRWCCISCRMIHTHKTLNYVEVKEFSHVPKDLQFITLALRFEIDTLITMIEHGIESAEQIKKLKDMLPNPYEGYTPLWE
jgi:hypothetical protein